MVKECMMITTVHGDKGCMVIRGAWRLGVHGDEEVYGAEGCMVITTIHSD